MPEYRQNIITGEWVVVAPERAKRPEDFIIPKSVKVPAKDCPLCVGSHGYNQNKEEGAIRADYENFYVVKNRFPVFIDDLTQKNIRTFFSEDKYYSEKPALGIHDVVAAKKHGINIYEFGPKLISELMQVIQDHYNWISKEQKAAFILPIYNQGAEAAASLDHAHAQIFGSSLVTGLVSRELDGAEKYHGENGKCVYCDMIKHEKKQKVRVIAESEKFIALEFYAPRFTFETWILPKDHESQFEKVSKTDLQEFAKLFDKVLNMLNKTLDEPPINFYIHTLPANQDNSDFYHWHLEIAPRLAKYGGFELGSDIIVNTMPPEDATEFLKGSK